jgi:thymidylate synthase
MSEGFPLLTTKKMPFKIITTELLWFLRGDTNIKYLVDNGVHIWDGDAYKNYEKGILKQRELQKKEVERLRNSGKRLKVSLIELLPKEEFIEKIKTDDEFAEEWGELGPIYGKQWRSWKRYRKVEDIEHKETLHIIDYIDQIANLINDLKTNPDSRRLLVSAWNVGELDKMTLPPCHYGFQMYTRELSLEERVQYLFYKTDLSKIYLIQPTEKQLNKENIPTRAISLSWNQRSVDTFLGLPFNIASYGLLLEIIAKSVNMVPEELIGNLGDTHLYLNHIEQAKEQIGRELSLEERKKLYENEFTPGMEVKNDEWLESKLTTREIPKRTREPYPLPTLNINTEFWPTESGECGIGAIDAAAVFNNFTDDNFCRCLLEEDIQLGNYQSHPHIKAPLSN